MLIIVTRLEYGNCRRFKLEGSRLKGLIHFRGQIIHKLAQSRTIVVRIICEA